MNDSIWDLEYDETPVFRIPTQQELNNLIKNKRVKENSIIVKKKGVNDLQALNASYLQEVATYLKLNANCKAEEKVGSGPGSYSGGSSKSTDLYEPKIIKVFGKPYSRINIVDNISKTSVNYLENKLIKHGLTVDLIDISPTIGLIGSQGMTLSGISGNNKNDLKFNISGIFISDELFDDSYYKKVVNNKNLHVTENGKLPVLSSDAKSKEELIKMVEDHEIGHLLLQKYRYNKMKNGIIDINSENINSDPEWKSLASAEWKNGFKSTTHGDSSSEELFAEAYCALENNRDNMFPDKLIDFVKQVKNQKV